GRRPASGGSADARASADCVWVEHLDAERRRVRMIGGRVAAEWLKAQGVTHVFALCGEHVLPLLDGCDEAGIRVIGTRHEQAAVLAAEAFARVSGKPGVAVVTAGPGVTNAMTGLAVAQTCGSP